MDTRYNPSGNPTIVYGTDPWLVEAGTSNPVDLTAFDSSAFPVGVFAPVNNDYGIERDDESGVFDGDFEAAAALAEHLSDLTGLRYEIWFTAEEED